MDNISKENYLKKIFILSQNQKNHQTVSLQDLTRSLNFKASSITNMLKKLDEDKLIIYEPYKGVRFTPEGRGYAIKMIRKHRLWEYFLCQKLKFDWSEVHEIAEQLEHISSNELVNRLEEFLEFPNSDPHGDPIPDRQGNFSPHKKKQILMSEIEGEKEGTLVRVIDGHPGLLNYLKESNLVIGSRVEFLEKNTFDDSFKIRTQGNEFFVGKKISDNLLLEVDD